MARAGARYRHARARSEYFALIDSDANGFPTNSKRSSRSSNARAALGSWHSILSGAAKRESGRAVPAGRRRKRCIGMQIRIWTTLVIRREIASTWRLRSDMPRHEDWIGSCARSKRGTSRVCTQSWLLSVSARRSVPLDRFIPSTERSWQKRRSLRRYGSHYRRRARAS